MKKKLREVKRSEEFYTVEKFQGRYYVLTPSNEEEICYAVADFVSCKNAVSAAARLQESARLQKIKEGIED